MSQLLIIGGGPAGMMAAYTAAKQGIAVTLLEKNEKLGKKLYITGKGRCNLTNNTDLPGLMSHVVTNPRFLHSAFSAMDSAGLMAFFEDSGVKLKTERGGRVFPVSDKSADINDALKSCLSKTGVKVYLNSPVQDIKQSGNDISIRTNKTEFKAQAIVIATGGLSYPSTGSTGDGYIWAKSTGHAVTPTYPSLVPLVTAEPWVPSLSGLSLKNVRCTVRISRKIIYEELGEMMFTETGVTGPLILSASAYLADKLSNTPGFSVDFDKMHEVHQNHTESPSISIDLKPGLTPQELDSRILRDFAAHQNKDFANALDGLLPGRLIQTIISLSNIPPQKKVHTITKAERQKLVHLLKNLQITPQSTAGYKEAVITKGGVSIKNVNPSTLMSKIGTGIFFAGEVLDVDALTGGYNLQIAFSTGYLAGLSAAKYVRDVSD